MVAKHSTKTLKRISHSMEKTWRHKRTYAKCKDLERRITKAKQLLERALTVLQEAESE